MNKTVTIDLVACRLPARPMPRARRRRRPVHPQSLLDLPPGEARDSLLAVHGILGTQLPPAKLAIYEAGGGSTSFLPLDVLRRAHVTVVDIDEDQIRNNDYAQETILGDIQTYRFAPDSFDLVICYNVIEHLPDVEAALIRLLRVAEAGRPDPDRRAQPEIAVRRRHQILAALVPCLVLPPCARRQECRPARPGAVPDLLPSAGHAFESRSLCQRPTASRRSTARNMRARAYPEMRLRKPLFAALLDAAAAVMNLLLPGKADVRHGDYHVILRKR